MTFVEIILVVIFWLSLALLLHNYFGIKLYLKLRRGKRLNKPPQPADMDLPSLTVIVPVHNEEDVIESRILNLLEQDYPPEKLDIVIGSDNSTDRSVEIAGRFSQRGVRVVEMPERMGKLGVIDFLTPRSESDVIVITDANVIFAEDALSKLAERYSDPQVGGVCGNLEMVPPEGKHNTDKELKYRNYETTLKIAMSRIGKLIGAYGGLYSFRRSLFQPLGMKPCHDDVIIPLEVLAAGYDVIIAEDAHASETTRSTILEEYKRRTRMAAYNLMTLPRALRLSFRAGLETAFIAFSYKILRWLNPYILALMFISALILAWSYQFYACVTSGFGLMMVAAVVGHVADRYSIRIAPAFALYHFGIMNVAGYAGLLNIRKIKRYWLPRS